MPERSYRRLHEQERHTIYRMRKAQYSQSRIAEALGCNQATISRELSRNRGRRGYRPKQAQEKAQKRLEEKRHRSRVIDGALEAEVRERLLRKHSPEQVSGALRRETGEGPSRTSIYNYISADKDAGGDLHKNLRINGKRRYRHRNNAYRHKLPARVDISVRPTIVNERGRYGDRESDLIQGGRGYLLSLYERKSHVSLLAKLESKDSSGVADAIIEALKGRKTHTITYDNGLEFADHERVNAALGSKSYFCKPYHSWEKGGVENSNGLLRQYFPRGTDFLDMDEASLVHVERELNERPRKALNYNSPANLQHMLIA
jgi:transposase, IS30 family